MNRSNIADKCIIVAEIAQAHDGSLGMAHAYIDAVAKAGADAVKFQTHIASAESSLDEPWRVKFSLQDETRYDYWKRMEFTANQWRGLKQHADERNLLFLSSPFSFEAIDLLENVGIWSWKVASGEITNEPMLERMIETGLPIILSSGMSKIAELDNAVEKVMSAGRQLTVLQCTTAYPCPPERVGLNMIPFFQKRYGCPVGLSDHSGTIYSGIAAATMGAKMIEVHVTFSREMFGPDVPASVTVDELRQLATGIRFIETALQHPVDKEILADELQPLREMFSRSIVVTQDLKAGTVIERKHLTFKKPGIGIPSSRVDEIIGCRLKNAVTKDSRLSEYDLECSKS